MGKKLKHEIYFQRVQVFQGHHILGNLVPSMGALVKTWTSAPPANEESQGVTTMVFFSVGGMQPFQFSHYS